jgi:hypothetical protein
MIHILSHYGDILAIPFFLALVLYFYRKEDKSLEEEILFYFCCVGLAVDLLFSIAFLSGRFH